MSKLIQIRVAYVGFISAFALLLLAGTLGFHQMRQLEKANDRVIRSHQVLETLANLSANLQSAELTQHSYLMTAGNVYLTRYQQVTRIIQQNLTRLKSLTQPTPDQQNRLNELGRLIQQYLALSQNGLSGRQPQGRSAAVAFIVDRHDPQLTNQISGTIEALNHDATALLTNRDTAAIQALHRSNVFMLISFLLSIGSLGWGFFSFYQQYMARSAAEARRQENERFNQFVAGIQDYAIFLLDPQGIVLTWNEGARRIKGYAAEEIIGQNFSKFYTQKDVQGNEPEQALAIADREGQYQGEGWRVRRGGAQFWATVTITALRDDLGNLRGFAKITRDITERVRLETILRESEMRLRAIVDNVADGIVLIDEQSIIESCNPAAARIFGYAADAVCGQQLAMLMPTQHRDAHESYVKHYQDPRQGMALAKHRPRIMQGQRQNGEIFPIDVFISEMVLEGRRHYVGIVRDITERKKAEATLLESEERFRATFEHAPVGIRESSLDGKLQRGNRALCEMMGYRHEEMEQLSFLDLIHPLDREEARVNLERLLTGEIDVYRMENRFIRKDGSIVWTDTSASFRRDPETNAPKHVISIMQDITSRKKAEEALRQALEQSHHLANHDPLTGLTNRAHFIDRLQDALAYAQRDGHYVAVHLLDLDRFKYINDSMGHQMGDQLLKQVATRILSVIRQTDVAARLGGDEFVVIQTHLLRPQAAKVLAGKLIEELMQPYNLNGQEIISGTSIGIAVYPEHAIAAEQLMRHADMALYEAKSCGRHNYQFYTPQMGAAVQSNEALERDLRRAMVNDELDLYYLPQFDLKNGRICGVEALLRWNHPGQGIVPADDFIALAEETGLILPIGEWALRKACRQHRAWTDAGLIVPMTINIASKQLRHPKFVKLIEQVLKDISLSPYLLQLEIQENVLLDSRVNLDVLRQLKALGVRLSLDNFGTEFTALSCLHNFPLDVLKLSKKFMQDLSGRRSGIAMMIAIITLANSMNIEVCAEGVETEAQVHFLKNNDCQTAQGFYLSPPLDAAKMAQLLEEKSTLLQIII